jgi:hypothetical protein
MDPSGLAALLAPIVPYLLKSGIEAAKGAAGELGKKLSADSWEGVKKLAEKIRHKAEKKPALQEALTDAQTAPADEDTLATLRLQLKKLLQEDPALLAEAAGLLMDSQTGSKTVITKGSRSVAIGRNASGNVIVTGDHNQVKK